MNLILMRCRSLTQNENSNLRYGKDNVGGLHQSSHMMTRFLNHSCRLLFFLASHLFIERTYLNTIIKSMMPCHNLLPESDE